MSAIRQAAVAALASKQVRDRFMRELQADKFVLYSQAIAPVCSKDDFSYREILIRFKDEEQNLQSPGMFLPLLEEQGLMPLMDRWIVSRVLKGIHELQAGSGPSSTSRFSVNLCADTIRDESAFGGYVLDQIRKTVKRAQALTFEILVSDALANPRSLPRLMLPLRSVGCSFALSGYAGDDKAFELARSLGFGFVKIDGSMLHGLAGDPKARERLHALNRRCHEYDIRTVCMQVEDNETLEILRGIEVDYAQGFGIERPRVLEYEVGESE